MSTTATIGFCLQYGHNEQTQLACALADYVEARGLSTSFRSLSPPMPNVDAARDAKVTGPSNSAPLEQWRLDCSTVIWFGLSFRQVKQQCLAGRRNILVYLRNDAQLTKQDLAHFEAVVCLNLIDWKYLQQRLPKSEQFKHIPADTAQEFRPLEIKGNGHVTCIFSPTEAQGPGSALISTLGLLTETCPHVKLSLLRDNGWSTGLSKILRELSLAYPTRFNVLRRQSKAERLRLYADSDLTLSLSEMDSSGIYALESLYCGRPVLTLDYEPLRSIINESKFGWLANCTMQRGAGGEPGIAKVSYSDLLLRLHAAVTNQEPAVMSDRVEESLSRRQIAFRSGWKALLRI